MFSYISWLTMHLGYLLNTIVKYLSTIVTWSLRHWIVYLLHWQTEDTKFHLLALLFVQPAKRGLQVVDPLITARIRPGRARRRRDSGRRQRDGTLAARGRPVRRRVARSRLQHLVLQLWTSLLVLEHLFGRNGVMSLKEWWGYIAVVVRSLF